MSNLALLCRPQCFNEIIGQELTTEQIINHLDSIIENPDDLIQPIILSGPRGTGKTSTARLIGQYLNCLQYDTRNTAKPCNCENCEALRNNSESNFDFIELDAATHNGVADIEKIVDQTFYTPLGSFKIIVLDEAHMLSRQAFNKLLKQLEEPPKRILYILATTEEHKIIETVRSRCKIRHFNLIADEKIDDHLYTIINDKTLVPDPKGMDEEIIKYIVSIAKGSMRDAIKTLDEVLDLDERTLLNAQQIAGSADAKKLGTLLKFLFEQHIGDTLVELHKLEKSGIDAKKLMEQLQFLLSDMLNIKSGAAITRFLSPDYYKEKFDTSINITDVCNVLGSLIATEGIARNISFHTLTYALVKCHELLTTETIVKKSSTSTSGIPTIDPRKLVRFSSPPSNVNPQKNTTTADKLAQILSEKKTEEKPIKVIETEDKDDEALF